MCMDCIKVCYLFVFRKIHNVGNLANCSKGFRCHQCRNVVQKQVIDLTYCLTIFFSDSTNQLLRNNEHNQRLMSNSQDNIAS